MLIKFANSKITNVFKNINDLNSFVKTSSKYDKKYEKRILQKIANDPAIKSNPDNYTYLRNRSISSNEFWGANQNWDAFPDKELRTKYSTFLNCRIDVDHICNGDDDIIGMVLDSMYIEPQIYVVSKNILKPYNETVLKELMAIGEQLKVIGGYVENLLAIDNERAELHTPGLVTAIKKGEVTDTSMGCFPDDTPILTLQGYKNIQDIVEGDYVKTHTGEFKEVVGLFSKYFDSGLYTIKAQGNGEEFGVTYEHPFLTIKKEELECSHPTNKFNDGSTCHPDAYKNTQCQKKNCTISNDKDYNIEWVKSQDLRVGDYVAYVFDTEVVNDENESKDFARLLGYYLSDGCYHFDKRNSVQSLSFYFGSHEMQYATEVIDIVNRLTNGYKAKLKVKSNLIKVTVGNTELANKVFTYAGRRSKEKKLNDKVLKWTPENQLELLGAFINGDGGQFNGSVYFSIANYELTHQLAQISCRNGIIWTIQTEKHIANENSVCKIGTESICWNLKFGKSFNKKLATVSDKVTHLQDRWSNRKFFYKNYLFSPISKIEFNEDWQGLIYNFEVKDDNSYVANNLVVHNCSVKLSECSVCGNKAESEDKFCDHIKYSKGKMVEGKLCFEINHGIEFFEDSVILSDEFARKCGKSAQAGGEGADQRAKILEIINDEDDNKSILGSIKKVSNLYNGGSENDYVEIGEEPSEITEVKDEMYDDKEDRFKDKSSIYINDKNVLTERLNNFIKESKSYKEFESNVVGLIGEELSNVSVIKCKSFYNNNLKKANKNDLLALVKGLHDKGKTRDEIQSKLKTMNYKNDEIAEALGYLKYKDGYEIKKLSSELQGDELLAPQVDRYKDSLEDDGFGVKDDMGEKSNKGTNGQNSKMGNPLFAKINMLKNKLSDKELPCNDCEDMGDEDAEIIKEGDEEKFSRLKSKLNNSGGMKNKINMLKNKLSWDSEDKLKGGDSIEKDYGVGKYDGIMREENDIDLESHTKKNVGEYADHKQFRDKENSTDEMGMVQKIKSLKRKLNGFNKLNTSFSYNWNNIGGYAQEIEAEDEEDAIEKIQYNVFNGELPEGFDIWETMQTSKKPTTFDRYERKKTSSEIGMEQGTDIPKVDVIDDKDVYTWDEQDGKKKLSKTSSLYNFKNEKEFEQHLLKSQKSPDVVKINNVVFTMDNYDDEGKEISYGSKDGKYTMFINTPDRYETGMNGVSVEIINAVSGNRPDVSYAKKKSSKDSNIKDLVLANINNKNVGDVLISYGIDIHDMSSDLKELDDEEKTLLTSELKNVIKKKSNNLNKELEEYVLYESNDWYKKFISETDRSDISLKNFVIDNKDNILYDMDNEYDNGGIIYPKSYYEDEKKRKSIKKKSTTNVPTELQPGSTVEVKDEDTATPQTQGQITDVNQQVTPDGNETVVTMNDGKEYSTDDFNIDKQSILKELQAIDFTDDAEKYSDLNEINSIDISDDLVADINKLDEEDGYEFDDYQSARQLEEDVPYSDDFDMSELDNLLLDDEEFGERRSKVATKKSPIKNGFKVVANTNTKIVDYNINSEDFFE